MDGMDLPLAHPLHGRAVHSGVSISIIDVLLLLAHLLGPFPSGRLLLATQTLHRPFARHPMVAQSRLRGGAMLWACFQQRVNKLLGLVRAGPELRVVDVVGRDYVRVQARPTVIVEGHDARQQDVCWKGLTDHPLGNH